MFMAAELVVVAVVVVSGFFLRERQSVWKMHVSHCLKIEK